MKKLNLLAFVIGMLALSSCNNSTEEVISNTPETPTQKHSLGLKFVDKETYNSFTKIDINTIAMKLGKNAATAKSNLPSSFTMSTPAVGNQGSEGSCVAWAIGYAAFSTLELNFKGITAPRSPEYVFNQIKLGSCSAGAYMQDGLNLLRNQGACSWAEMPYTDAGCSTQPNTTQRNAASTHKLYGWGTFDKTKIEDIKANIFMKVPIIIAVTVDDSFYNMNASTGWIWKSHSGFPYGGHALCVVGYDDAKQAFKVQNSWGSSWGSNGYFWIDYSFFAKTNNGAINECYIAF